MFKTGTVKFFKEEGGWGFIKPDDGGEDIFVHWSAIQGKGFKKLQEGENVRYEVVPGAKGPQAANVTRSSISDNSP